MKCDNKGRTLQLYFIDGKPDGMLTAEVFNWTGHVLMAPRTQLKTALTREEVGRTGVYILLGERQGAEQEGETLVYIGRAEDISRRIRFQDIQMDWWETAVFVTSANNNLNAAHVTYLEARLIEEARAIGLSLYNDRNPARPSLSEADQANMEVFLDYLLMTLPALRIDMFPDSRHQEACCCPVKPAQENEPVVFGEHQKVWGIQVACGSVSAVLSPAFSPGYHCSNFPAAYRQGFASDLQHEMRPTVFGALSSLASSQGLYPELR